MSLVFTKNQDQSQVSGRPSGLLPYRWSNYFTQPLRIPPNSQVAYISSSFNLNQNGNIQDEPIYMTIGTPALNMPIPIIPPERFVDSWKDEANFLAELANQYGTDNDYTDIYNIQSFYEGVDQKDFVSYPADDTPFQSAINIYYRIDDKVDIYSNARAFQASEFNQGFNCLSRNNVVITYDNGDSFTTGLNTSNSNYAEAEFIKAPATGSSIFASWSNSVSFVQPDIDTAPDSDNPSTLSNFYNTQYTFDVLSSDYLWSQTSAQTLVLPDFDEIAFSVTASSTGIKKYIGGVTPTANGGGHAGIGEVLTTEESGGYAIYGFGNTSQISANTHFDLTYVGDAADVGFCGIAEQFVGVQSIPFIQSFAEDSVANTFDEALAEFNDSIDINQAPNGELAQGTFSRYVFGVRIYEAGDGAGGGTLWAQAEMLDPNASLSTSKYISVGGALDIKALSNGINTAVMPSYEFDAVNDYVLNTYNYGGSRIPAMLQFRFRWTSPYTMAVEYTMSIQNDETSYNMATDVPYVAQPYPAAGIPVIITNPVEIRLTNVTDGDVNVLQDIDGAGTIASEINFFDSGGGGGDYSPNQLYTIDFDVGSGFQAKLVFNSFEFEHATFAMYDRLGIQVSNDGSTWTNFSGIPWMNTSNTSTPPYSTSYGGLSQSSNNSFGTNGYILPQNEGRAIIYDGTATFPYTFQTSFRYIRFNFISDGSSQADGWDITIQPNTPYQTAVVDNADPRVGWVKLYDMLDDYTAGQNSYYIPSYFGDMGLVSYHVADNTSHYTKGYYDVRRSYRYDERLFDGATSSKSYTSLNKYAKFFTNGSLWEESILQKNNSGFTTPKLVGIFPETFVGGDSGVNKLPFLLLNTIKDNEGTEFAYDVNFNPMFKITEPIGLEMGYILGWIKGNSNGAGIVLVEDDIVDYQTKFLGITTIQLSDSAFSNHVQITNLPIQSQNGVVSSQNKLIYVVNSLGANSVQTDNTYRIYNDTAPVLLWVDLNNFQELNINKLDMLITDDSNRPQKLLVGTTDVVLMFRQKTEAAAGYLPNNIPVRMGNNLSF